MTDKVTEREPLIRAFQLPVNIRSGGDGRTVYGICAPFGERTPSRVSDSDGVYFESFSRGAFSKTLSERGEKVFLYERHLMTANAAPIGRPTELVETEEGLYGEFYIPRTSEGEDALERAREGLYTGFSVGMVPIPGKTQWTGSGAERHALRSEVALLEVSLVTLPAYDAPVSGIRALDADALVADSTEPAALAPSPYATKASRLAALYHEGIL